MYCLIFATYLYLIHTNLDSQLWFTWQTVRFTLLELFSLMASSFFHVFICVVSFAALISGLKLFCPFHTLPLPVRRQVLDVATVHIYHLSMYYHYYQRYKFSARPFIFIWCIFKLTPIPFKACQLLVFSLRPSSLYSFSETSDFCHHLPLWNRLACCLSFMHTSWFVTS